jgi:citrate lyase subunit beta/citryl-CoA lyase
MKSKFSYLFVPALKTDSFFKSLDSTHFDYMLPYSVIFDLEDSINTEYKESAREELYKGIDKNYCLKKNHFSWYIRINSYSSSYFDDDIKWFSTLREKNIGIMLPKCNNQKELEALKQNMDQIISIIPLIETIEGFENRNSIFKYAKSVGIKDIAFGAGDLSLELGVERDYDLTVLQYVTASLLVSSKRIGLRLIDSPSRILPGKNVNWEHLLTNECIWANQNGFTGKMAVHPAQVHFIERTFSNEGKKIWAQKVINDFEKSTKMQAIRSSESGNYIGTPILKYAQNLLKKLANENKDE